MTNKKEESVLKVEVKEPLIEDAVEVKEATKEEGETLPPVDESLVARDEDAKLREMRVRVSGLIHICKAVGQSSMEKINAVNSLYMVRGWLGDVLEYLGEESLNNNVNIDNHKMIDDDTDLSQPIKVQVNKSVKGEMKTTDANELQSVNHVRRDVEYVQQHVSQLASVTDTAYETFIFQHLREAKFWLDRELFRIKDLAKENLYANTSQGKRKLPKRPEKQRPLVLNRGGGNSASLTKTK